MLQITLEADYAVRCLVYLKNRSGRLSNLGDISRGTLIPEAFLSKILQKMIRGGLVRSQKGKNGGFSLARDPELVSVHDVLEAACGSKNLLKLVCDRGGAPCMFLGTCRIRAAWRDLEKIVRLVLAARKLSHF